MAVLDDDFSIDATLTECGEEIWSSPKSTAAASSQDFQSLYEEQRVRTAAAAAAARCEELRWADVAARRDAGVWTSRFKSCRQRLSEAEEAVGRGRQTGSHGPGRGTAAPGNDQDVAQGECPAAQGGQGGKGRRRPGLRGFARPGRRCRRHCPAWMPSCAGPSREPGAGSRS